MASKSNGKTPKCTACVLTERERVLLCAETGASMGTVRRWGRGEKVQPRTRTQLTKAAKKLAIPVPKANP